MTVSEATRSEETRSEAKSINEETSVNKIISFIKDATQDIIITVTVWSLIGINNINYKNSVMCELLMFSFGAGLTVGYLYKYS